MHLKAWSYPGHINQKVLKQSPYVIAGVYLFHLDFCVHIAVVEEVNVRVLHLGYHQNMLTAKISPWFYTSLDFRRNSFPFKFPYRNVY